MTIHENHKSQRGVSRIWTVQHQKNSSIHTAGSVLNPRDWQQNDPFLFLQEDWFQKGVFDLHPHRGQETVTYVIEGNLEHYDNNSGSGTLGPGDVQWMTAGRGVIHKEDASPGETVHSLQLWINLPSTKKMAEPRYQNLRAADMPTRVEDGVLVRVFSGSSGNIKADTQNHVPVTMLELTMEPGTMFIQELPSDYNGFLYVLEGSGYFGVEKQEASRNQVVWLGESEQNCGTMSEFTIRAKDRLRAILYAGQPTRERIVQYGPFVMNTEDEIRQAISDFQNGRFTNSKS